MFIKNAGQYFELQDPQKARWLPMEGLRGIAVLLVFFVHYSTLIAPYFATGEENNKLLEAIREAGNSGVDLFFVLSGFLIYRAVIRRPINYAQYAYRRIERIYPVFLFVLCIYTALSYLSPAHSKLPELLPDAIIYIVQNVLLLPGMLPVEPIITVAWSLSFEAFYYILAPAFVGLFLMRHWKWQHRLYLFLAIYAIYIVTQWFGFASHFRLTMFLGGIVLYEISQNTKLRDSNLTTSLVDWISISLFALGIASFTLLGNSRWVLDGSFMAEIPGFIKFVILNCVFVLIIYRCLFAQGPAAKQFSFAPLRWLGNMSYTYYLMHSLGLHIFFNLLSLVAPSFEGTVLIYCALIPFAMIATLLVSAPVYLLIERPISLKPKG